MVESTDQGSRNIINALTKVAPKVAQVKQEMASGQLSDVDISAEIVSAAEKYHQLKTQNKDVGEYLQQQDFVGELSPEAKAVLRLFNENSRSAKRISAVLNAYYQRAETQGNTAQSSMFGEAEFDKAGELEQAKNADLEARYSGSPIKSETAPQRNSQTQADQQALSEILGEEIASHIEVVDRNTVKPPKGQTIESLKNVEGWYDRSTQKAYIYSDGITEAFGLTREERLAWVERSYQPSTFFRLSMVSPFGICTVLRSTTSIWRAISSPKICDRACWSACAWLLRCGAVCCTLSAPTAPFP